MRLVINQADPVSNIAVPMFKIVDAVQIAANAGWPNAPNREGTGFANIAENLKTLHDGVRGLRTGREGGPQVAIPRVQASNRR